MPTTWPYLAMTSTTKLPPVPWETLPPGKKITKSEVEGLSKRLFYDSEERKKKLADKNLATLEGGMHKVAPISKDQLNGLVGRIYKGAMDKATRSAEILASIRAKEIEANRTVLDAQGLDDFVGRVYTAAIERQKVRSDQLIQKYRPDPKKKKLTKDQQAGFVARNCEAAVLKRKEEREKLYQKVIVPLNPVFRTLTKEEVKASAERLCVVKK